MSSVSEIAEVPAVEPSRGFSPRERTRRSARCPRSRPAPGCASTATEDAVIPDRRRSRPDNACRWGAFPAAAGRRRSRRQLPAVGRVDQRLPVACPPSSDLWAFPRTRAAIAPALLTRPPAPGGISPTAPSPSLLSTGDRDTTATSTVAACDAPANASAPDRSRRRRGLRRAAPEVVAEPGDEEGEAGRRCAGEDRDAPAAEPRAGARPVRQRLVDERQHEHARAEDEDRAQPRAALGIAPHRPREHRRARRRRRQHPHPAGKGPGGHGQGV